MFKRILVLLFFIIFISGCDLIPGGGNNETSVTPSPVLEWGNLTRVADTYDATTPPVGVSEFISIGQIAATPNAVCVVIWTTATYAYAGCRSTVADGQWSSQCAADVTTGIVTCGLTHTPDTFLLASMGAVRTLTVEEAELADEIRRLTYCTALRSDGSSSPCAVL